MGQEREFWQKQPKIIASGSHETRSLTRDCRRRCECLSRDPRLPSLPVSPALLRLSRKQARLFTLFLLMKTVLSIDSLAGVAGESGCGSRRVGGSRRTANRLQIISTCFHLVSRIHAPRASRLLSTGKQAASIMWRRESNVVTDFACITSRLHVSAVAMHRHASSGHLVDVE